MPDQANTTMDPDIVLYQRNHYKPLIDRALKLTETYISNNKLILTGGMAIDLALRAKGKSIYDDDTLPDFDIISDSNLKHANALAELLCKAGLPDINVINAVHITTVRVRMKNIVFLDATYIPPLRFKQIPFLDIGHLRVVHPHYQFIDQRLSLSHLMMDTGLSLNVFNRLTKDIHRNALLRSMYPITSNLSKQSLKQQSAKRQQSARIVSIPLSMIQVNDSCIDQLDPNAFGYTGPACIAGYVGMMLTMLPSSGTLTKTSLDISVPSEILVRILSCDIPQLKKFITKPKLYRPLLNLKPISQQSGDFEFVDTYGSRPGCNLIRLSDDVQVCVASVDYLLMELLRDRIYVSEEPFSQWYSEFVEMVDSKRMTEPMNDTNSIWMPSINCYGRDDLPEYRIFMLEKLMKPDEANTLKPRNSYPNAPKCQTRSGFEQETSHYFRMDGIEDKRITHTNYKYVIDAFHDHVARTRTGPA